MVSCKKYLFPSLALFLFCCSVHIGKTQAVEKLHRDYNGRDYGAAQANFDIIQDHRGVFYIANFHGLLSFYGENYNVTKIVNDRGVFKVHVDSLNRIIVAAKGDFGYLKVNTSGIFSYISLKPLDFSKGIGRVQSIVENNQRIYIAYDNVVFEFDYNYNLLKSWEFSNTVQLLFEVNGDLFVQIVLDGIKKLKSGNWSSLNEDIFDKTHISTTVEVNSNLYLMGFPNGVIYKFGDKIETIPSIDSEFLKSAHLFDFYKESIDGRLPLASRKKGVVLLDSTFRVVDTLNQRNALPTNVTTATYFDHEENLWVTHQNGLTHIDYPLAWQVVNNNDRSLLPWDILKHNDSTYIFNSEGVYLLDNSSNKISYVKGVKTRAWKGLRLSEQQALVMGENGLFSINKKTSQGDKLLKFFGITNGIHFNQKVLIATEFAGLFQVSIDGGNKASFKKLSNVKGFAPSMLQAQDSSIWVSMQSDGVYRLTQSGDTLVDTKFTQKHGLPDVQEVEIIEYDEKLLFATGSGFYQLNPQPKADSSDLFIPHTSILPDRVKLNNVVEDPYHNLWVSITDKNRQQHVEKLALQSDGSFERLAIPFKRLPDQEYTCIYPDPEEDSVTWIAGTAGLFRFDGTVKKDYTLPFNTLVRQVDVGDSTIFYGNYYDPADSAKVPSILLDQPDAFVPVLPYEDNSLSFHYVATSYEMPEKNRFSYYLEGFDEGWSNWTKERKKEYGNLDAGTYVFHVKSKNVYDTIGRVASYRFEILPPWYQTIWANIVFALLAAFGVWLIVMAYSYRIRVQRRKLKLIVADRTFEVLSQKREIESQNKELRYKNEEIKSQRDAIQHKNSELESYQKEILTINQQLNDLNSQLELKVEKRTSKIKTTLKRLQQTNKELDLFIYRASHDLKGPISRVNGLSTLAKLEGVSDSTLRYLELIEDTSKDMERLLSKLTQVHEIFNLTVDRSPVDIPSVFNDVRENVKSYDRGYKTKYSFDLKDEERFVSDVRLFRLIVENLVENALIFRKNDQQTANVLHEVKTQTYRKGDDFYIKIYDNGLGIDEENLPKIFEMFYRGSDQSKGSGLGLYLVYLAVEKLHGTIEVKSKRYEYTEFTIILPQHTRSLV